MLPLIGRAPVLAFNLLQQISHRLREFNQTHLREVVRPNASPLVGNFARAIVHDLKNPLSIIGLSAEMFDMPDIRPELRARTQGASRRRSSASAT